MFEVYRYPRITMMGTCDWSAANGAACVTRHQLPWRLLWNEQHSYAHHVLWHAWTYTHLVRETWGKIAKGWCQKERHNANNWIIAFLEISYAGFVSPPKMADRLVLQGVIGSRAFRDAAKSVDCASISLKAGKANPWGSMHINRVKLEMHAKNEIISDDRK